MKNEIKEILDLLKYCVDKNEYLEEPNMKKWKPLLDYITNLQQENERLKDELERLHNLLNSQAYQDLDNYKSRCEKAIEYIESNPNVFYDENLIDVETLLNNEFTDEYVGEIRFISTLLNILQNGSEDNE